MLLNIVMILYKLVFGYNVLCQIWIVLCWKAFNHSDELLLLFICVCFHIIFHGCSIIVWIQAILTWPTSLALLWSWVAQALKVLFISRLHSVTLSCFSCDLSRDVNLPLCSCLCILLLPVELYAKFKITCLTFKAQSANYSSIIS